MAATDLYSLPRPVLALALSMLPLDAQLRACACCKLLNTVVLEECLPRAETLDLLTSPGHRTAAALRWLAACGAVRRLRSLSMQGAVCHEAAHALTDGEQGRRHLATLTTLVISDWKKLANGRLQGLLVHCTSLRRLEFSNCQVGDDGLGSVASCCPQLEHLDCSHCRGVSDDGVAKLALGCHRIKSLVLDGCIHCTDQALALLAMHAPQLEHLSVAKCFKIGDAGIRALCTPSPTAASGPSPTAAAPLDPSLPPAAYTTFTYLTLSARPTSQLRSLSLAMCPRVSDVAPLEGLVHLQGLELTGCVMVQNVALLRAVSGCATSLQRLRLNNCVAINGDGVVSAVEACKQLRVLCVRGLGLRDDHLGRLAGSTGRLTELNISMCHAVTDWGVHQIVAANPGLERLEVEGDYLLSDAVITTLRRHTPRLSDLSVRMCNALSYGAMLGLVLGEVQREREAAGGAAGQQEQVGRERGEGVAGSVGVTRLLRMGAVDAELGVGQCQGASESGGGKEAAVGGSGRAGREDGPVQEGDTTAGAAAAAGDAAGAAAAGVPAGLAGRAWVLDSPAPRPSMDAATAKHAGTAAEPDGQQQQQRQESISAGGSSSAADDAAAAPATVATDTPDEEGHEGEGSSGGEGQGCKRAALPGCVKLRSIRLGGVLSEAETTRLVRRIKAVRPDIVLRV